MLSQLKDRLSAEIIEIINIGKELVIRASLIPANLESRLVSSSRTITSDKRAELKRTLQKLLTSSASTIKENNIRMKGLEDILHHLNPQNILQRGYSITTVKGKVLKSTNQVKADDIIDTYVSDGFIKSKVTEKNNGNT
jgi:exodeoxyribonuclease VII large subunit